MLNFALNLEYLEAQFYSFAATGAGLPASMLTGTGTQGAVTGGAMVNFMGDTLTHLRELARAPASPQERDHEGFLRLWDKSASPK